MAPRRGMLVWPSLYRVTLPPLLLQLSRFLWDHGDIAFAPLGKLMLENFKMEGAPVSNPACQGRALCASCWGETWGVGA